MASATLYPWQQPIATELEEMMSAGRLAQSILIDSEEGHDSLSIANWLQRRLMCLASFDAPCGQCHSCHMLEASTHPDSYLIEATGKTIGVDEVRQMNHWAVATPSQGSAKVAIICDAEKLTTAAANALLKLLEEPQKQTYFILLKPLQSPILPTIMSRMLRIVVKVPQTHHVLDWLAKELPRQPAHVLQQALIFLGGSPLSVVKFFNEQNGAQLLEQFSQGLTALKQRNSLALEELLAKNPEMLEWLALILIDSLKAKYGQPQQNIILDYLDEQQLTETYQKAIELKQNWSEVPGLNMSVQLYPIIDRLLPKQEFPHAR